MKILMSGPIRPNKESVIRCIKSVKEQFGDCVIFLSTWETDENIDEIISLVDHFIINKEPPEDFIWSMVGVSTYSNMKKVWYYEEFGIPNSSGILRYNKHVGECYNPETIIKNNILNNGMNVTYIDSKIKEIRVISK